MAAVITSQLIATGVETVEVAITGGGGGVGSDVNLIEVAGTPITSGAGIITAGTPRVTIASDDPIVLDLDVLAAWDESGRGAVNLISGQVGVQGGSGTLTNNTQRVVLATDIPLPAGTNAIGKLAANSGVDIGDVDITSIIPGTSGSNLGKAVDSVAGATDTGVAALVIRDDVLGALTPGDGDYTNFRVDAKGAIWNRPAKAATATLSNVSSLASNQTLLSTNNDRLGVTLYNDSTQSLFVKYGATASSTSYTVKMGPGDYWEMPQPIYAGQLDGIWDSANGAVRITELT